MQLRSAMLSLATLLIACAPCARGVAADARIEAIKSTLKARYPQVQIEDVQPAPIPHLYEVFVGDSISYTDEKGDYLLVGSLVETQSKRNLTTERLDERNAIDFQSLPFEHAIKNVKGDGSRQLAVFSDPDCPYCQKLEKELATMTDVTIYTFLYPLTNLHPQALAKARSIWCSSDRQKAWTQWMLERTAPQKAVCETDPVEATQEFGKELHILSTPTLFLANGRRISGAMPAAQLEPLLK